MTYIKPDVDNQLLLKIKTQENINADLKAKEVQEKINNTSEFKSIDHLKEFLLKKRDELTKQQVACIKNDGKFSNEFHDLKGISPNGGK
jgi:DNA polymerase II large subunit